jgi:GNAT superfamily N-acetyltransferase
MALDLDTIAAAAPTPPGLRIAVDDACDWPVDDLPYYTRHDAAMLQNLGCANPRRSWKFAATLDGAIVGHSHLYLTAGRLGVAGIYSVGVVPSARNRGIGKAVSLAACRFARDLGCHYAVLNSAADPIYTRLGFVSLGYGQTWWMHAPMLAAPPPSPAVIAFAEAIGHGDIPALDALDTASRPGDVDAPLPNGMTPMALAVAARKPASADWLAAHGATLDVLHAWDLGWKARARRLVNTSPDLANRRTGDWQITPLHEAVSRGDAGLVRLLLTANPDLDIEDTEFHSTPLGWARHFGRQEIVALLQAHRDSSPH